MSDESRHKVEDYLQFTPLASAVSVRPLIEVFNTPEVVTALPKHDRQADDAPIIAAEQDRILQNILQRAKELRGSL